MASKPSRCGAQDSGFIVKTKLSRLLLCKAQLHQTRCGRIRGGRSRLAELLLRVALLCFELWRRKALNIVDSALQGFETLTQLRVLDVSNNRITSVPCLRCLTQLQACFPLVAGYPACLTTLPCLS